MNKENNYIDDIDRMTNEVYVGDENSEQEYDGASGGKEAAYQEVKEVIQQTAREDEQPASSSFSLREILGGDILSTQFLRQQIWLILLIALFSIIYVGNRYSCQKKMLTINPAALYADAPAGRAELAPFPGREGLLSVQQPD